MANLLPALPSATATRVYLRDLLERVVWTFLQSFGGALIVGGVFDVNGIRNLSAWQAAALAGVAAILSLVKGLVAKFVGNPETAALI